MTIYRLVDSKELPPDWRALDRDAVLKIVKPHVYKDCVKEQPETVDEVGRGFGRYCNGLVRDAVQKLIEG